MDELDAVLVLQDDSGIEYTVDVKLHGEASNRQCERPEDPWISGSSAPPAEATNELAEYCKYLKHIENSAKAEVNRYGAIVQWDYKSE